MSRSLSSRPPRWSRSAHVLTVAVLAVGLLGVAACSDDGDDDSTGSDTLTVRTVSTRADLVTGGDVLVGVAGAESVDLASITVTVDGEDREVVFEEGATVTLGYEDDTTTDGRVVDVDAIGLVTALPDGESTIEVTVDDETASVDVVNHPVSGPVLSGPAVPIEVCTTEANGLGPALDELCSAESVSSVRYADAEGTWHDVTDAASVPDDAVTDSDGNPLVVEREIGTINRAVYWIDVPENWNGRLVYQFGGGCGTSYSQGFRLMSDPTPDLLAAGYATATATFNTFQVMCNPVLSAETALMVKEHFAETVGVPELTIGQGGSGGAIQQYMIIQGYPGLLDASLAASPFPDAVSIATDVLDCALFVNYFDGTDVEWSPEERLAVEGFAEAGTCQFWDQTFAPNVNPSASCSLGLLAAATGAIGGVPSEIPSLAPDQIFDAETNPDGLRCTLQDSNVNYLGRDPETGYALRPWDNTGVQYGLAALNDGEISVEQFLDLNENVGSHDINGTPVAERADGPIEAYEAAWSAGAINEGAGDLRRIPIITVNVYTDDIGDIHTRERAFAVRERLKTDDGGDPPNHMIWTRAAGDGGLVEALTGVSDIGVGAVQVLDEWATALRAADASDGSLDTAIEDNRPEAAVDNCVTPDGERVAGLGIYDEDNACTEAFPVARSPRLVAGAPLRNDIVKCTLIPVDEAVEADVYSAEFSDAELERLVAIFPDGVCDWSQPSVGRVDFGGTWQIW